MSREGRGREVLKTFVGGLPFHCNEQELGQFMTQFGHVLEVYISRDQTGHHKGFAFVNFINESLSDKLFGEHYFKSKLIEVKKNLHNQLLLQSLPEKTDEASVRKAIEELGFPVAEVTLGNESNGVPPGSASVRLVHEEMVPLALAKEKVTIKDAEIEISTRANKRPGPSTPQSKDYSNKKKTPRHTGGGSQQTPPTMRDMDRRLGRPAGLSMSTLSTDTFDQPDSFLGYFQNFTRMSINGDSEPSTVDLGAATEPDSGQFIKPTRKLSSSLKTNSKEYFPSPSKPDSLHLVREGSGVLSLDNDFGHKVLVTTRHNSECGIPTDGDLSGGKKLNGCSTSFYSAGLPSQSYYSPLATPPEVRIRFYTFPDRE